jgi:hypothetical protein
VTHEPPRILTGRTDGALRELNPPASRATRTRTDPITMIHVGLDWLTGSLRAWQIERRDAATLACIANECNWQKWRSFIVHTVSGACGVLTP